MNIDKTKLNDMKTKTELEWNDFVWPDKGLKNLAADKCYFSQGRQDFKKRLKQEKRWGHFAYVEEGKPVVLTTKWKAQSERDNMNLYSVGSISEEIDKFIRSQVEHKERTLAEIISKHDFIVGSQELKHKLLEVLPEGANIICTPYIESPTMIYAVKKFDITDYWIEPQESEGANADNKLTYCPKCSSNILVKLTEGKNEND